MYSVSELYGIQKKPKRGKINIQLLLEYYDTYLRPFNFRYELSDGVVFNLKFDKKRFSHLLGVEKVAKERYQKVSVLQRYRGETAYKRIKNGEITDKHLRNLSEPIFYGKAVRGKFIYFYQIPHILLSPKAVFRYKKVSGSDIECEILIYDIAHGVCVHLGIEKDDSGKFYVPRTFFADTDTMYIRDQDDEITLNKIEQIKTSDNTLICSIDLEALRNPAPPVARLETENNDKV